MKVRNLAITGEVRVTLAGRETTRRDTPEISVANRSNTSRTGVGAVSVQLLPWTPGPNDGDYESCFQVYWT